LKETEVKGNANHKWLINKGNEQNEKFLYWDKRSGFRSDDSYDEEVKFNRFRRFYNQEQMDIHGDKPYLK